MKKITIKIIFDNCRGVEGFQEGWGFSCLIDLGNRKVLFDTGADPKAFFYNLANFSIPCEEITHVVFSHKHSDHIAGLEQVLDKLKEGSRLYVPKNFPTKKIPSKVQLNTVNDFTKIDDQIYCLTLKAGWRLYEQALVLKTSKGLVIVTGCAHPGIVHLIESAQKHLNEPVHLVLGGFHLFRDKGKAIQKIVDQFQSLQVECAAPCHCTGDAAIEQFRHVYQDRFYKVGAGTTLTLE